jgi:hypothetical protein
MCRELEEDYGFETVGVNADALNAGQRPPEVREADLVVTTPAYEPIVRRIASQADKPCIIADVRTDLIGGERRLLLRKPVYVIVRDAHFRSALISFFDHTRGKKNLHVVVVDSDDISAIPPSAPTFSSSTADELLTFVLKANLAALSSRA